MKISTAPFILRVSPQQASILGPGYEALYVVTCLSKPSAFRVPSTTSSEYCNIVSFELDGDLLVV